MLLSAAFVLLVSAQPVNPPKAFEFKDGDRIVWIGNTMVEREQRYGYWETALIAANADKNITFRNLGWSGDTVFGEARARFDFNNPDAGFKQLVNLALELKPTVIFISYGTNEAFEGKEGLPKFEKGLEKLLDALKPANARIALFTPLPFLQTGQTPDVKERNANIAQYADAIRTIATKRNLYLADTNKLVGVKLMLLELQRRHRRVESTVNGMHLTEWGYQHTAAAFLGSLGGIGKGEMETEKCEQLRKAIVDKNEQFFNKWRPQNETYLFGFRKHEQGKNAKEIAEFDPFITKAEDEIAKIRKGLK